MEGLDAAPQDLGLAGILGDLDHLEPVGRQGRARAAAGQQLDAAAGQARASSTRPRLSERSEWPGGSGRRSRWGQGSWSPWLVCRGRGSLAVLSAEAPPEVQKKPRNLASDLRRHRGLFDSIMTALARKHEHPPAPCP